VSCVSIVRWLVMVEDVRLGQREWVGERGEEELRSRGGKG